LDIACGPGYVSAAGRERNLLVTGVDFSEAMIDFAQSQFSEQLFQVGDAENLNFSDNHFDHVCSNFGMLHFADSARALREAYRVCKPRGRFAYAVWNHLDQSPAMSLIMQAVGQYGDVLSDLPEGPSFFQFADEQYSFEALEKSGFINLRRDVYQIDWRIASAEDYVSYFRDGGARIGAVLRAQTQDTIKKIIAFVDQEVQDYEDCIVPASIVVTSGER